MSRGFYCLLIVGVDQLYRSNEQQGKCSHTILLIEMSYYGTNSISLMHPHSYFKTHLQYNRIEINHIPNTVFNFEVTRFVLETIFIKRAVSQVLFL